MDTNTLTEAELVDFMRNDAVKRMRIEESEEGKYRVVVELTWKKGEFYLLTTRKTIREWASLDRLIAHIKGTIGVPPETTLTLMKEK